LADEPITPPPAPPGDDGKPPAAAPAAPKPAAPAAAKPAAAPPKPKGPVATDASAHPVVARLKEAIPDAVLSAKELVGQVTVEVPAGKIAGVCRHLKEKEAFTYLVDLTAVDWKERQPRFDMVYWLHSFEKENSRIRLRVGVADGEACPTVSGVWLTANWMEREVFDLFGIPFSGHPDLRRILTWDGFQGHPLRKDFPVEGIDTGAAIYPDRYPDGGGPAPDDSNRKVVS
jgi:NADH-quinone oxidoreductase subunit C